MAVASGGGPSSREVEVGERRCRVWVWRWRGCGGGEVVGVADGFRLLCFLTRRKLTATASATILLVLSTSTSLLASLLAAGCSAANSPNVLHKSSFQKINTNAKARQSIAKKANTKKKKN